MELTTELIVQFVIAALLLVMVFLLIMLARRLGRLLDAVGPAEPISSTPPEETSAVSSDGARMIEPADSTTSESEPQEPVDEPETSTSEAPEAAAAPQPEEAQPYQRDGRWWFEREGELLVYDEMAREWRPHVEDAASIPQQAAAVPGSENADIPEVHSHPLDEPRPTAATAAETTAAETTEPQAVAAGHWRCPACGVINGSSATTCRMCFAARP